MNDLPFRSYRGDDDYIFASYAHYDAERVFAYLRRIRELGHEIWYDEGIEPGSIWRDTLAHAIIRSRLVLFFATKKSVVSENCANEVNFAVEQGRPVLPIYLEQVTLPPGLHLTLAGRQALMAHNFPEAEFAARVEIALNQIAVGNSAQLKNVPPTHDFDALLHMAEQLLLSEKRVTYRSLKRRLQIDDDYLHDICHELIHARQVASDEDGRVLVGLASIEQTSGIGSKTAWVSEPKAERRRLHCATLSLAAGDGLEKLDIEDRQSLMEGFENTCTEVVERYGGKVFKVDEGTVQAYFGYPVTHEDEVERLVRCLKELCQSHPEFEICAGAHSGLCVVDAQRVSGDAPGIACRLAAQARPGGVRLSEVTQRLLFDHFDSEPAAPVGELATFYVGEEARVSDFLRKATDVPLTGREAELRGMYEKLALADSGRGQVVMLSGEPAIGKSRLAFELLASERTADLTQLEIRCSEVDQAIVLAPIVECIERLLGIEAADSLEERARKLADNAAGAGLAVPGFETGLAVLLNLPLPEEAPSLSPADQRQLAIDVVLDIFDELAANGTLITIWEDLHWADATTLDLLRSYIDHVEHSAALVILTFRPEFIPQFPLRGFVTHYPLSRLAHEHVSAIIGSLTDHRALPAAVVREIMRKTDGVPLFVEEITKSLLEADVLVEYEDHFELQGRLAEFELPETLADSLLARLDRMGTAKTVAQIGAVLGREFDRPVLLRLLDGDEQAVESALAQLVHAEILYRETRRNRNRYVFKHALVQETAYNSLLKRTREQYHLRAADILSTELSADAQPGYIARHYAASQTPVKAVEYYRQAGRLALGKAANTEAIEHLRNAQALLVHVEDQKSRQLQELDLCMQIGPALMAVRGYSAKEVTENYTRARELCELLENVPDLYPVWWGLWAMYFVSGQLRDARRMAQQIYDFGKAAGERRLVAPSCHALAFVECYSGNYGRAIEVASEGLLAFDLEIERENVLQFQLSSSIAMYVSLAESYWMTGCAERAEDATRRMLELADELDHPPSIELGYMAAAWLAQHRHDAQAMLDLMDRVREVGDEGEQFWPTLASVYRAWLPVAEGDPTGAITAMRRNFDNYRSIGGGILSTQILSMIAEAQLAVSDFMGVIDTVDLALAWIEVSDERHLEPELIRLRALARYGIGNIEAAIGDLNAAISRAAEQQAAWSELRCLMTLAEILSSEGMSNTALEPLARISDMIGARGASRDLDEARALIERTKKAAGEETLDHS